MPTALQDKTFRDIDAGWWYQTCAIESGGNNQTAGKLHCWGSDTRPIGSVPTNLQNLTFRKVSAGREHNCAVTTAGQAKCWGNDNHGRATVPAQYENSVFVDIDAGQYHTCGVTDQGGAACWGADGDLDTPGIQVGEPSGLLVNFGQADPPQAMPAASPPPPAITLPELPTLPPEPERKPNDTPPGAWRFTLWND